MAIQRITSGVIADGAIVATDIADGAITGDKIGVGQITANLFAAGAVSTTSISNGNSNVTIASANSNVSIFASGTERMRVTTDGNVGIGTSSPTARLQVSGSVNNSLSTFGSDDVATLRINNANGESFGQTTKFLFSTGNIPNLTYAGIAGVYTTFNGPNDVGGALVFGTQANASGGVVERARITSGGNFAIGTTSAGAKLTIADNTSPRISCQGSGGTIANGGTLVIPITSQGGCIVMVHNSRTVGANHFTSQVFAVCGRAGQGYTVTSLSSKTGDAAMSFTLVANGSNAELLFTNTAGQNCDVTFSVIGM